MIAENPPRFAFPNPDLPVNRELARQIPLEWSRSRANVRCHSLKENCIICPDWKGVIEGGFQQSSSWVRLFEIARKLEVRNLKIDVHYGAELMVGIE